MNTESFVISAMGRNNAFIGDDAAVVGTLLYSQDAFFENVHFKTSWMTPYQIGYKSMIVNISDAIAMNAQPQYALLTLALPKSMSRVDVTALIRGLKDAAALYKCQIIGGDTIANTKLDISITIVSQSSKVLHRHRVREGDLLAFTGKLGSCKKDLHRLFKGAKLGPKSRFIKPVLRQSFVQKTFRHLNSGMDISDGLYEDSKKLTAMIGRVFKPTRALSKSVTCSGEEYEMLVSFPARKQRAIQRIAQKTRTPLTVFAQVTRGPKKSYCKANHF